MPWRSSPGVHDARPAEIRVIVPAAVGRLRGRPARRPGARAPGHRGRGARGAPDRRGPPALAAVVVRRPAAAHGRGGAAGDHPPGPHLVPQPRLPRRSLRLAGAPLAYPAGAGRRRPGGLLLAPRALGGATRAARGAGRERGWCCWAPITGSPPCAPTQRRRWSGARGRAALPALPGTDFLHKNRVFAIRLLEALRSEHGWEGSLVLAGPKVAKGSSAGEEAAELPGGRTWRARGGPGGGGRGRQAMAPGASRGSGLPDHQRGVRTRAVRGRRGGGALPVRRRDGPRRAAAGRRR